MLSLATRVKSIIQTNTCKIESVISPLHYKATTALLFACCAVVSSQQYFGSPIECIQDINDDDAVIPPKVINSFCFITATYTQRTTPDGHLSNIQRNDAEARLHSYYQWVPIVLFLQATLFTLPRTVWVQVEGRLIAGCTKSFSIPNTYPSQQNEHVPPLAKYLSKRVHSLTVWGLWHIGHDVLNLINTIFNIYLTEIFLGRKFMSYGVETSRLLLGYPSALSPMDEVFPKLTKCEFHKYGPSGTLQRHDVLCLMAMNIVNEKLYYILWLWLLLVLVATGVMLLVRFIKLILLLLRHKYPVFCRFTSIYFDSENSRILMNKLYLTDIIFLEQLKVNLDKSIFKQLISSMTDIFVTSNNGYYEGKYNKEN